MAGGRSSSHKDVRGTQGLRPLYQQESHQIHQDGEAGVQEGQQGPHQLPQDHQAGHRCSHRVRREKVKAEADLKKSQAAAAAVPDCSILKLEKAHANKKIRELTKLQEKDKKTIQKLEKKVEELEKELKKVKSTTDLTDISTLHAHGKKSPEQLAFCLLEKLPIHLMLVCNA
jgi:predicted  nucleic acid-binding Zn-ribbon protein